MATFEEAEAVELLTRVVADLQATDRNPAREKAAAALLDALKALSGRAGLTVKDFPNPREGGLLVEVRGGNAAKRAWVGKDEWGVFWVRPLGRGGTFVGENAVEVIGLRLDESQERLEGSGEDTFFTPEPGHPRRQRSALAVLMEAITSNLGP